MKKLKNWYLKTFTHKLYDWDNDPDPTHGWHNCKICKLNTDLAVYFFIGFMVLGIGELVYMIIKIPSILFLPK